MGVIVSQGVACGNALGLVCLFSRPVPVVVVLHLEVGDAPCDRKADDERQRERELVVLVEVQLRQHIRQRDAEENTRGEGQRVADDHRVCIVLVSKTQQEDASAQGHRQGKQRIDQVPGLT